MTFTELLNIILPYFVQVALIVLIIVFIILGIKLIKLVNNVNLVVTDVNNKIGTLNGIFGFIDEFNEKISSFTGKIVENISNFVLGLKKKKYNNDEEDL